MAIKYVFNPFTGTLDTIEDGAAASGNKTVWFEPNTNSQEGNYRIRNIGTTAQFQFTFRIPADFDTLVSLQLIWSSNGTNAGPCTVDLTSDYGLAGDLITLNSEFLVLPTFAGVSDEFDFHDLSGVFSSLAAGHTCGVLVDHVSGLTNSINYFGILLEYSV